MANEIGPKVMEACQEMIQHNLTSYMKKINEAYLNQDCTLTVNLALKFQPAKEGVSIDCGISFVESKVKAGVSCIIDEAQPGLPFPKKEF